MLPFPVSEILNILNVDLAWTSQQLALTLAYSQMTHS